MLLLTRSGLAIAAACLAVMACAAWTWNALALRDARIAQLQAQLHAAAESGSQRTHELAQCRAAVTAVRPQDAPRAQTAQGGGTPQLAAVSGTSVGAPAPMDLGAALQAFQASQPPPGSAGLSPFAAQR